MTDDRTTLKSTLVPDRDHLHVEASNPVPGSIFLEFDARWCAVHVDANELRAAIDKAVGPADSPLTPDAITDEMVGRALAAHDQHPAAATNSTIMREALTAALTEPPARPEGAEGIERVLRDYGINDGEQDFADFLAKRGVRVVGEEDPR